MKYRLPKKIIIKEGCITITVNKGFRTDGVSIPKWAQFITGWRPLDKDTLIPSIVHDKLYKTKTPRLICDLVFLHLMKQNGVSFIKRWTYFKTVLVCGGIARRLNLCYNNRQWKKKR